jgi:hypothetical protein
MSLGKVDHGNRTSKRRQKTCSERLENVRYLKSWMAIGTIIVAGILLFAIAAQLLGFRY